MATPKRGTEKPEVETTGHEWDGIRELNNPLPKWWVWVFYATIVWGVGYMLLYPSVPGVTGYFGGLIGHSQRATVERQVEAAYAAQGEIRERVETADIRAILDDPEKLHFALAGGRIAFADNCVPCHGPGGAGLAGFPGLADDAWIWGGTPDAILETIRYGVRSAHLETRSSLMPAFGADGMLDRNQIDQVTEHVLSLSGRESDAAAAAAGAEIYAAQCASCHGRDGTGMQEIGAPDLTDAIWIYGGSKPEIARQIRQPRHGVMPAWVDRLDEATIRMLAAYVHALGGGE